MEIPVFQPARLKDLREAKGLTAQFVAARAEISQGTLTKIENGLTADPGSRTLAKIARVLDAPMEYFYLEGRDPDPRRSAVEMSFAVFVKDKTFMTAEQRRRCAAAVTHKAAPRSAEEWKDFCAMVESVFAAQKLRVVKKGKG